MASTKKPRKKKPTKVSAANRGNIVHSQIMKLFPFYRNNFFVTYSSVQYGVKIIEPKINKESLQISEQTKNEFLRLIGVRSLDWQCLTIMFKSDGDHVYTAHSMKGVTLKEAVRQCVDFSGTGVSTLYDEGGELHGEVCRWGIVLTPSFDIDILESYNGAVDYFYDMNIMNDELIYLTDEISALLEMIAHDKAKQNE
jgi:hypothetical protein